MPDTKDDHGRSNGLAWFQSIVEMVDALRAAETTPEGHHDYRLGEDARETIQSSVLCVEVRSDWHAPMADNETKPAEYRILLATGGPALQLTGELSEHGEPETARLEHQDWGTPWTPLDWTLTTDKGTAELRGWNKYQAYLLDFARQFYFGE